MKYQELYNEYVALLEGDLLLQRQLQMIPKGYIVTKHISGKPYSYLQYTVQGKKKSDYLNEEEALRTREAIAKREPLKTQLENNRKDQDRLERAAKILDVNLTSLFYHMKQCMQMDAMPIDRRFKALAFARAMTALEGLDAKESTEQNLLQWARGEVSFSDFYMRTLKQYGIVEG